MTPEALAKSGSEFGEQSALFCWCNLSTTRKRFPWFYDAPRDGETVGRCKLYSINNNAGADGDKKTAAIRGARAKQLGLKPGVADIFLPLPRHGMAGLYIELKLDPEHPANIKAKKKGTLSPAQCSFGNQAIADGYGWTWCQGWKAAVAVLEQYLTPAQ